jgi:hypothetical protein
MLAGNGVHRIMKQGNNVTRGNGVYIAIAALAVLVILVAVFVYIRTKPTDQPDTTDTRATFVTEDNVDEVKEEMSKPIDDGSYECIMNTDWHFSDGSAVSYDAYVENSENNSRTVYFDVALDDTQQVVYSSPYLPLGSKLDEIRLDQDLDAGEYGAIVTYYLVDDDHNVITDVSVRVTLHIES